MSASRRTQAHEGGEQAMDLTATRKRLEGGRKTLSELGSYL
jgi:hypothetical protein